MFYCCRVEANGTSWGKARAPHDGPLVDVPATPRTYHVWVSLSNNPARADLMYPGLVLGWRKTVKGWEAHTIWVTPSASGDETSHVGWLEAHRLHPGTQEPVGGDRPIEPERTESV